MQISSSLRPFALVIFFCCIATLVCAESTRKDSALDELLKSNKLADVERITSERVAANPRDETAYAYLAISALNKNESAARTKAYESMERCISTIPSSSICHLMAARLLGVNAMEAGILKAMGSVGRIRELFTKALELDPKSFEARRDLIQFYLQAPAVAGGSTSRARELAQAGQSISPEYSALLNANIALYEKNPDLAEKLISPIKAASGEAGDRLTSAWLAVGLGHLQAKSIEKAKSIFQRVASGAPDAIAAHFFLGRAQLEAKEWDAALASFATTAKLDKAGSFATEYRSGLAYQGKGDKAQAKIAFQRALAWPRLNENTRKEINQRLRELTVE